MEGRVTGQVTPNDNPQEPVDAILEDSVDRISNWVDQIAQAEGAELLPAPVIPPAPHQPELVGELPPLRPLGSRLRRRGPAHVPPHLTGLGRVAHPIARATIPVVETEESELLSPALSAAQRNLEQAAAASTRPVVPLPGTAGGDSHSGGMDSAAAEAAANRVEVIISGAVPAPPVEVHHPGGAPALGVLRGVV